MFGRYEAMILVAQLVSFPNGILWDGSGKELFTSLVQSGIRVSKAGERRDDYPIGLWHSHIDGNIMKHQPSTLG